MEDFQIFSSEWRMVHSWRRHLYLWKTANFLSYARHSWQYASAEFRRPFVGTLSFVRHAYERCLRKRWGKCYRRCIVKFNFLAFTELVSIFYYVYLWVRISNNTFKENYSELRYNLSIPCHFKVGLILKLPQKCKRMFAIMSLSEV